MKEHSEPSKEETKLQSEQKTLQQCKDQIAKKHGYKDYHACNCNCNASDLMQEAAELYASQFKSQLPIEQKDEEIAALKQELRRVIHEKDKEISRLKSQLSPIEGVEREPDNQ